MLIPGQKTFKKIWRCSPPLGGMLRLTPSRTREPVETTCPTIRITPPDDNKPLPESPSPNTKPQDIYYPNGSSNPTTPVKNSSRIGAQLQQLIDSPVSPSPTLYSLGSSSPFLANPPATLPKSENAQAQVIQIVKGTKQRVAAIVPLDVTEDSALKVHRTKGKRKKPRALDSPSSCASDPLDTVIEPRSALFAEVEQHDGGGGRLDAILEEEDKEEGVIMVAKRAGVLKHIDYSAYLEAISKNDDDDASTIKKHSPNNTVQELEERLRRRDEILDLRNGLLLLQGSNRTMEETLRTVQDEAEKWKAWIAMLLQRVEQLELGAKGEEVPGLVKS